MSADNEICILELIDKVGNKEYRVADNVSMSYNTLPIDIDLTNKEQLEMVYNIWKDALSFNTKVEANMTAHKWEEEGYYEYGTAVWRLNIDWEDFILLAKKMGVC